MTFKKLLLAVALSCAFVSTAAAEGVAVNAYVATSTVTGSASGAQTFIENDVNGYASALVQFTSVGSGNTVTFEGSNDNAAWVSLGAVAPSTSVANEIPLAMKYFRARVSTFGSGTVSAAVAYKSNSASMQGNVASGAADSGNPVKMGGKYNSTLQTLSNGQRGDVQLTSRGAVIASLCGDDASTTPGNCVPVASVTDNAPTSTVLFTTARIVSYNGIGWDPWRLNMNVTLLASAARTATLQSADQTNFNGSCVHVVLNVTSAGTGSITLTVQGKDSVSSAYYTLIAGAAVTTNSTNVYKVCPGITVAANVSAADILPRTWRIDVTHNNANSITYSVGASVSAN
jgi:hypothetical protein